MTGTFAGALEARHIPAGGGRLSSEVRGDIVAEDKVLVIRRIHIVYRLQARADQRETIERVHQVHHHSCPVYRSLYRGIEISSEFELVEASA
jgi:uncharacterized OsmC-like protein